MITCRNAGLLIVRRDGLRDAGLDAGQPHCALQHRLVQVVTSPLLADWGNVVARSRNGAA